MSPCYKNQWEFGVENQIRPLVTYMRMCWGVSPLKCHRICWPSHRPTCLRRICKTHITGEITIKLTNNLVLLWPTILRYFSPVPQGPGWDEWLAQPNQKRLPAHGFELGSLDHESQPLTINLRLRQSHRTYVFSLFFPLTKVDSLRSCHSFFTQTILEQLSMLLSLLSQTMYIYVVLANIRAC